MSLNFSDLAFGYRTIISGKWDLFNREESSRGVLQMAFCVKQTFIMNEGLDEVRRAHV